MIFIDLRFDGHLLAQGLAPRSVVLPCHNTCRHGYYWRTTTALHLPRYRPLDTGVLGRGIDYFSHVRYSAVDADQPLTDTCGNVRPSPTGAPEYKLQIS